MSPASSLSTSSLSTMSDIPPSLAPNYSHSYFPKGFRRYPHEREGDADHLAFETGSYGLLFDLSDLTKCYFGEFDEDLTYEESLSNRNRMELVNLQEEVLIILIETKNGSTYRVVSTDISDDPLNPTSMNGKILLWEAGRIVQRYEFTDVHAITDTGEKLVGIQVDVEIVVWPDAFTLTVSFGSEQKKHPKHGKHRNHHHFCHQQHRHGDRHHHHQQHHHNKVHGDHKDAHKGDGKPEHEENKIQSILINFKDWSAKKEFPGGPLKPSEESLTLSCKMDEAYRKACEDVKVMSFTLQNWEVPRAYEDWFLSVVATLPPGFKRTFRTGNTDIRHYDDYTVKLTNGNKQTVYYPFVILMKRPANITGLVPVVCRPDGTPTGIPIQVSKNWHDMSLGPYAYFFVLLPVPSESDVEYLIRTVYGFYYDIPSASAAQLSLVGYGKSSGRWDQLAIGCFGETFCMDPEMSIVPHTITDIRGLMLRNGVDGQQWCWTDCGWGGDNLKVFATEDGADGDEPLLVTGLKTAYMSHGPCFTDTIHEGYYGSAKQVSFVVRIRTARTDDLCRTFLTMTYTFHDTVYLGETGYLHNAKNAKYATPAVALGNLGGAFEDKLFPGSEGFSIGDLVEADVPMIGEAPHWISFYKNERFQLSTMGPGTKHVIIRRFVVASAGETFSVPSLTFACREANEDGRMSVEVNVRPPEGIKQFLSGDTATIDVQWMTTPGVVDNYYGPNHELKGFLTLHPMSWQIVKREVDHNYKAYVLTVEGGTVESTYAPARIRVEGGKDVIILRMKGGVGGCPVEFVGLEHPHYKFYRVAEVDDEVEVEGCQIDYNPRTSEYKLTYTMMLGGSFRNSFKLKEG